MPVERFSPRTTPRVLPVQRFQPSRIAAAILVGMGVPSAWAESNNIVAAGGSYLVGDTVIHYAGTATNIATKGSVTDITTETVRGQTGFNSFSHFQVGSGNTVNLYVPGGASNLVNLVHDSRVVINGTLNGVLADGNRIGGHIIFADPHGLVVGASGVVNVGSLTITTPSTQQMQQLSGAVGTLSADGTARLVDDLRNGLYNDAGSLTDYTGTERGKVEIKGRVNAVGAVNIFGAAAVVANGARIEGGKDIADAVFRGTVNTEGLAVGQAVARADGAVRIVGRDSATVSGELAALMADGSGANVSVSGGQSLELTATANISTQGAAGKNGGKIALEASTVNLRTGSTLSTRASGAGRSGDIQVSAVSDGGCTFCEGDQVQTVAELTDRLSKQPNTLLAPERGVASVNIEKGAVLDASHAEESRQGDIKVSATAISRQLGGYSAADASVKVAGTLKGNDISLASNAVAIVDPSRLGTLFDSAAIKADVLRIKNENGWSDEAAWGKVIGDIIKPITGIGSLNDPDQLKALGVDPADFSELTALIPFLAVSIAQADSTVEVLDGASLQASRSLLVKADSTRNVGTESFSIPVVQSLIPFNAGVVFGRISGATRVEVKSGAVLKGGQGIAVQAHSENKLDVKAEASNGHDAEGKPATTTGFAAAMANTALTTTAQVNAGASLNTRGDVSVLALSEQDISNTASFKSIGNGAAGGAVLALSVLDSDTRAAFDANLSGARNLNVSATNLVSRQHNEATSQAGKSLADFIKFRAMGTVDPIKNFVLSKFKEVNPTQPSDSKFRLAASLALVVSDQQAEASIGKGSQLSLSGDLSHTALQEIRNLHNLSNSTVNGSKRGSDQNDYSLSMAVAIATLNQGTRALVGDGAQIAAQRIGIGANYIQPLNLNGFDRWSSLSDIGKRMISLSGWPSDLAGKFSTQYANSQGTSDELAITGSVSVLTNLVDTRAWVGDKVRLDALATGEQPWQSSPLAQLAERRDGKGQLIPLSAMASDRRWDWAQPITVAAGNQLGQLAIAGNIGMFLFGTNVGGEAASPSDGKPTALGGALNVQTVSSKAVAGIGAQSVVKAGGVQVQALQDDLILAISPSAGSGVSAAANGAAVANTLTSTVNASIHNTASVEAGRVGVQAEHRLGLWTASGAVAFGAGAGVGGGLALNVLTTDVDALVGNNRNWRPSVMGQGLDASGKGIWKANLLDVQALSSGQSGAFAIAGAVVKGKEEKKQQEDATQKAGDIGKPTVELADSFGQALLQSITLGVVNVTPALSSLASTAGKVKDAVSEAPSKIASGWDSIKKMFGKQDAGSGPDGGGSDSGGQGKGFSIAAAGSSSINVSRQRSRADLGDIVLDPRDPAQGGSKVQVLALNQTHQFSGSGAGALTLAGKQKSESSSALSGALAYNHLMNETDARVGNVLLRGNDLLQVQALSAGDQIAMGLGLAVATAGSETNVAVALSGSAAYMGNRTRARVENSQVEQREAAPGSIEVSAYDRARVMLGGGAFAGSKGNGGSAGGSLVVGVLANELAAEWLGSSASHFARMDVAAASASRVLAGALAGAVSTGSDSGAGAGSLLALVLANQVKARIDAYSPTGGGSPVLSSLQGGALNLTAQSVSGASALDARFAGAADATLLDSGLDLGGGTTVSAIQVKGDVDKDLLNGKQGPGDLFDGDIAGEAVLAVAGSLGASGGKAGVGGSLALVYAGSGYTAKLANSQVDLSGDLTIAARHSADVLAAAVSGAGSAEAGVSGSATALIGRGTVLAGLDMGDRTLKARNLGISAERSGGQYSLAGNITGSSGSTAVGGAVGISDMQQRVEALLEKGRYQLGGDLTLDASQQSRIISAAISAAVTSGNVAVGGALTFNRIADSTQALLRNARVGADDLVIRTSQAGQGALIGSLAFNLAASGSNTGVGSAIAINLIEATRQASLSDSDVELTGSAKLSSGLDGQIWGVGVNAVGGSTAGVGGSVVVNNIDGSDSVTISGGSLRTSGSGKALVLDAAQGQGMLIASLSGQVTGSGNTGVGGAFSVNRIGTQRSAAIDKGTINGFSSAALSASLDQAIYAAAVSGAGASTAAISGSSTSNVIEGGEKAGISASHLEVGSLELNASRGNREIWSLAGSVGGAGNVSVGVANANNVILAQRIAQVSDSTLKLGGKLSLLSGGSSGIRSLAIGGAGAGSAAVGASLAINVIKGEERASLEDSTVSGASGVKISVSEGAADIYTGAGNLQVGGSGAGAGAVAISTIEQQRIARVRASTVDAGTSSVEVSAVTDGSIRTLAVSGSVGGTGAVALSNASNNIGAVTRAQIDGSAGVAGVLKVKAEDRSSIAALSGGAAGAGTAAVGVATSVNRVASQVEARLLGHNGTQGWSLSDLSLDAHSAATIRSASISGAVSSTASVGGSAATNVIQSSARAFIEQGAWVLARNNVGVSARTTDQISGAAGAFMGSGTASVGGSATVNVIESSTTAGITGAQTRVSALALGAAATIDNGVLLNGPSKDARLWSNAEQFNPIPDLALGSRQFRGLAVQASSVQQVGQLAAAGSVSFVPLYSASVAALGNSNVIGGVTRASIESAQINQADGADAAQQVLVGAASHALSSGYLASGALSLGVAAVAGALDSTVIQRQTQAVISSARVSSRGATEVRAGSTQFASTVLASAAGAIVGGAGNVALIIAKGTTEARVDKGSDLDVGSLRVSADALQQFSANALALAGGLVGVGANFGLVLDQALTRAWVGEAPGAPDSLADTRVRAGSASVLATGTSELHSNLVGAAAGGGAVAGSALVQVVETTTEAGAGQAQFGTAANPLGDLNIVAHDNLRVTGNVGSGVVGAAALGASANVVVANSATRALLDRSSVQAASLAVDALREGYAELLTTSGGLGFASLSGSIGLLLLGSGATQVGTGDAAVDPLSYLDKDGKGTLASLDTITGKGQVAELSHEEVVWDAASQGYVRVSVKDDQDLARVNASSTVTVSDRLRGNTPRTHETVARVSDSQVSLSGAARVTAEDRLASRNQAGSAGLAGGAYGAAMAFSLSNAQVVAQLLNGNLKAASLAIRAAASDKAIAGQDGDYTHAMFVHALSGQAAALGAVGGAVAAAVLNNGVSASLGGAVQVSGDIEGRAVDTQALDVQASGLAVGGLAGAGLVLGVAAHDSRVSLDVAANAALRAGNVLLSALAAGPVKVQGWGSSGGILGGLNAVVLLARDASQAKLMVGRGAALIATQALDLDAQVRSRLQASSEGYALGGLLSAGGSLVDSLNSAVAELGVGSDVQLAATQGQLRSRVLRDGDTDSSSVKAQSLAGGVGLSANAAVATARSLSKALLHTDASSRFGGAAGGNWTFLAETDVRQRAYADGKLGGLLALGATVAQALSQSQTLAEVAGHFESALGSLKVSALGSQDNQAEARAGQGGLVSGAAAVGKTADSSRTLASLWARGAQDGVMKVGSLALSALQQSRFNSFVDSTSAALLGVSGAHAQNDLDLATSALLLDGARIESQGYSQSARALVSKPQATAYNVQSGSGGVLDAAAARSLTSIALDTRSLVGNDVRLRVEGDWRNPQKLEIQAFNRVDAYDRVKLDSGGAISIARAESSIDVLKSNAEARIGERSDLYSVGDLVLAASGAYAIDSNANAKTYGAAGAASGSSLARVKADYLAQVRGNAALFAYGDLRLLAGHGLDGAVNRAELTARTDLWNNTAFPVVTDPAAAAEYIRSSNLQVEAGSGLRSVGDIHAYAGQGQGVLSGKGVGRDLYRQAAADLLGAIVGQVSLDITGGGTRNEAQGLVRIDGQLDAGVYSQRKLVISGLKYLLDGKEVDPASLNASTQGTLTVVPVMQEASDGITWTLSQGEYSQLLTRRLQELNDRLSNYGISAVERAAFEAERTLLNKTLARLYEQIGGKVVDKPGAISGEGTLPQGLKIWLLEIDPVLAKPGNILVQGDALIGSGKLNAPGDAKIEIINNSEAFLSLKGLEIPDHVGGQLLFNGARMSGNTSIRSANKPGTGTVSFASITVAENSAAPRILVQNLRNPADNPKDVSGLSMPAADIYVNGSLLNKRGEIELSAKYGSIYANADIRAQKLSLSAGQDFVLNNPNAFVHIGGDPASNNNGSTLYNNGSATVAGQNVVINALYLNINGLIQSGVADWRVTIDESRFANLDSLRSQAVGNRLQLVQTDARTGTLGYAWDFDSNSIVLDQVQVGGGYMELTGHILSTGMGQLKVLDGFSQVHITNNTSRRLEIAGLDLGNGVEGTLRINDLGRGENGQQIGGERLWSTVYTRVGDQVQRYEGWSNGPLTLKGSSAGRDATYTTTAGRSYVWLTGRDDSTTTTRQEYWDAFWGFIPTGDGTLAWENTVKGQSTAIPGAEYMGSTSGLYRIDKNLIRNYRFVDDAQLNAIMQGYALQLADQDPDNSILAAFRVGIGQGEIARVNETYTTKDPVKINEYSGGYCQAHFIWCQIYRTTKTSVYSSGSKEINRYAVQADRPIDISFIGSESGLIDLISKGSVTLRGSMYNLSGSTSIKVDGALEQNSDNLVIAARDLDLDAGLSIGSREQALRVEATRSLGASSRNGSIDLKALNGGVNLSRLSAGGEHIGLSAQGDILGIGGMTVTGNAIELVSTHGSVGSAGHALRLDSGNGAKGLVRASAVGDIQLEEVGGDLWLDQLKAGGDVWVKVASGNLYDGNSELGYDDRALDELQRLWTSMGLTGSAAEEAMAQQRGALIKAGQQRYAQYWRLRQGGEVAFDASQAAFSAGQREQLAGLGWSEQRIASEEARRMADYQALHATYGGTTYDPNFTYQLQDAELRSLEQTATWSEDQLRYSIAASLLRRDDGGSVVREANNIEGRNVTLEASRIGRLKADAIVIDLSKTASLTNEQRAALASAERDDIEFDAGNPLLIRVAQRDDVNVKASGTLTATAQSDLFLGGDQDFNVFALDGRSISLKTDGSIESANGDKVVIRGHDVTLEATGGAIGGKQALNLAVTGDLTARARLLDLVQHGDLSLDRLTGVERLSLQVLGNLRSASQLGENLLGGQIDLKVSGTTGAVGQRLQLGTGSASQQINLDLGGDAWIGGLQGLASQPGVLRLGTLSVDGTLDLAQVGELHQGGQWQLGGLVADIAGGWSTVDGASLQARHGMSLTSGGDVRLGDVTIASGDLNIQAASLAGLAAGSRWQADGVLRLSALGDIGSQAQGIELAARRLEVDSATGALYLALAAGIQGGSLDSGAGQWLRSLGNLKLDRVSSGDGVQLRGNGRVELGALSAQRDLDLAGDALGIDTLRSHLGGLRAQLAGQLRVDELDVAGTGDLHSASATLGTAKFGGALVQSHDGDLQADALYVGGGWTLEAASARLGSASVNGQVRQTLAGALDLERLDATGGWTLDAGRSEIGSAKVGGAVDMTLRDGLRLGSLEAGQGWNLRGTDAQVTRADVRGAVQQVLSGALDQQALLAGGGWTLEAASARLGSASVTGQVRQTLAGALDLERLDATGGWTLDAGRSEIGSAKVGGAVDMNLRDGLRLGSLEAGQGWNLRGTDAQVTRAEVQGAAQQVLSGALDLERLDATGGWTLDAGRSEIGSAKVGGAVDMTLRDGLRLGSLEAGQGWNLRGTDAQVTRADVRGAVQQVLSGMLDQQALLAGGDWTLQAASARLGSASVTGQVRQTLAGALDLERLDATGGWTLDAGRSEIGSAKVGGAVDMTLRDALLLGDLDAGGRLQLRGTSARLGNLSTGEDTAIELSGDLALQRLQAKGARVQAGNASRLGEMNIEGDLQVRVDHDLLLEQARVAGHAALLHGGSAGSLRFGSLAVARTLQLEGLGDWQGDVAEVQGDLTAAIGSGDFGRLESATGAVRLEAARHLAVDDLHSRQQGLELSAASAELGRASAAGLFRVSTRGDLVLNQGRSGGDMSLVTAAGSLGNVRFGQGVDPSDPQSLVATHLASGGNLLVQADGDVLGGNAEAQLELRMLGRNLRFGRVASLGEDVFLQASGDARQGHGNVFGLVVEAKRDIGVVAGGDLSLPTVLFGGTYSLKAGRDLVVGVGGDLDLNGVAEAGRDLRFDIAGTVALQGVRAGRDVTINSGGAIHIDQFVEAGGNVLLKADKGDVRVSRITSTGLHEGRSIAGDIVLAAAGDIAVAEVESRNGRIQAEGASLLLGDLVAARSVDLLSRGLIRVVTSRSGGDQRWSADAGIGFEHLLAKGQALLDGLLDIRGTQLVAEQGAVLRAGVRGGAVVASSIHLQRAEAPSLSLWAGDLVRVADAGIGQRLDLHARDSQLYGRHTGSGQLDLWAEGSGAGQVAQTLALRLEAADIVAPRLHVADALIDTTAARVDLRDARGVERLELRTPLARVRMDNASPSYMADADIQLYELDKAFSLKQDSLLSSTNAYVLHRKLTHQVVVPNFSASHEGEGVPYEGITAARYAEQHLSSGLTLVRLASLLEAARLRGAVVTAWAPSWSQVPLDTRINIDVADERLEGNEVAHWAL
ncbi:leukotoxin LktA family filamentous adhesin [Pseudomonas solani]|uniref:leukotoxin LktA family filamentous adhesin n=1 Tax=Pseudomonas solani TaxID=2731552 RepID=UPI003C2DF4FC